MKNRHSLVVLLFFALQVNAQDLSLGISARNSSLGGASATLTDEWSIFNNPGNLGLVKRTSLFCSYQNRYNIEAFQVLAAGLVIPFKKFTTGLGVYREGDQFFNRQLIKLGISNTLQMITLGGSISYYQYYIEGIGSKGTVLFDFGGQVNVIPDLSFAAHISNISQANIGKTIRLPTIMKAGFSYKPAKNVSILTEIEKNIDNKEQLKLGLEYILSKIVVLRTGITSAPASPSFGFGLKPAKFSIDYSFTRRNPIGTIHEFSLGYQLKSSMSKTTPKGMNMLMRDSIAPANR